MSISEEDIRQIVEDVWSSMLGGEISPSAPVPPSPNPMTGHVTITGEWSGLVLLDCSAELALQITDIMFCMEGEPPAEDEIQDAFGELTNMIGGNIKSLFPEPCHLSLPDVKQGGDPNSYLTANNPVNKLAFDCGEGQVLRVTVMEHKTA